ncbi:transmembrane protein, putative (macronuclear) [Tetrahymena thermophila SB210]|uniref:Transmembrane protein, putative n=1 Tax=Tetrahymena thermophila (strain SB210) TaxID=312017 RepID=W7XBE7_TETTS|nr:transmembrane protein, putative [Tetrahymena thermophila SB210]EWS73738.1 transmembrane protein, putative [Tetrahymena thermophila SB210]|eukprot:XP_012653776.1 transmembrane protein, putative [Tetrahymena thermophila SB210]
MMIYLFIQNFQVKIQINSHLLLILLINIILQEINWLTNGLLIFWFSIKRLILSAFIYHVRKNIKFVNFVSTLILSEDAYYYLNKVEDDQYQNLLTYIPSNIKSSYEIIYINSFTYFLKIAYLFIYHKQICENQFILLWMTFSIGLDLFHKLIHRYNDQAPYADIQRNLLNQLDFSLLQQPKFLLKQSMIQAFHMMTCLTLLMQFPNWLLLIYSVFFIIMVLCYYFLSIRKRLQYLQTNIFHPNSSLAQIIFHIDTQSLKFRLEKNQLKSICQISSIKYSLIQKTFLLTLYIFYLINLDDIITFQYFCLSLIGLSVLLTIVKYREYQNLINGKNPTFLETDNVNQLRKYIQQQEQTEISQNLINFDNVKQVDIYINPETFINQTDLLDTLLCSSSFKC